MATTMCLLRRVPANLNPRQRKLALAHPRTLTRTGARSDACSDALAPAHKHWRILTHTGACSLACTGHTSRTSTNEPRARLPRRHLPGILRHLWTGSKGPKSRVRHSALSGQFKSKSEPAGRAIAIFQNVFFQIQSMNSTSYITYSL